MNFETAEVTYEKPHRLSGILLHPTSCPSPYGIGDLGQDAYDFVDFLEKSGQHLWQILPLTPTGFGDSPYQSFSAFAGQPLLISPAHLKELGLLEEAELSDCRAETDTMLTMDDHPLEIQDFSICIFTFSPYLRQDVIGRIRCVL